MGVVHSIADKLVNAITGTGTNRDPRAQNLYVSRPLTQYEIASAYSGSGLMRKIVGIPALDMVREWREWTGLDDDQAAAVYEAEKRLGLRAKVRQAEVLRGMGGGALILGLPGNPSEQAPDKIGKDGLAFVHVVSRWHLTFETLQDDATEALFGEPLMWRMQTTQGQQTIHPSRVIPFRADTTASLAMPSTWGTVDAYWGESTVQQVLEAVQDSDAARAAFAALLHKARLLRIGIPGLMNMVSTDGGTERVQKRIAAMVLAESLHNATIYDAGDGEGKGGEAIGDATYKFEGAKDLLNAYGEFVAAISDIPATRLLGRAPEGLNSSGDSQQRDWNKKIRAMQTLQLGPCMDRLDGYLMQSATGSLVSTSAHDWAPLDTPTEKERADTFKTAAEAIDKVANLAAMPDRAFNRGVQSWLIAEGYLPELEAALAEIGDDERYGIQPDAGASEGGDPYLAGEGGSIGSEPPRRAVAANDAWFFADAKAKPLYVQRKLLNADELIKWAKANGLETTLEADDMHVTVLYSRRAVDPMKMGESWSSESDGGLIVKAGGPRAIEQFDGGAVVLQFASSGLQYRHEEMIRAGGSHDFDEYHPHVTLTYAAPEGFDVESIKRPFQGELRFGPEIFQELDPDWKAKIEEA